MSRFIAHGTAMKHTYTVIRNGVDISQSISDLKFADVTGNVSLIGKLINVF